jgi:spermidine synthase
MKHKKPAIQSSVDISEEAGVRQLHFGSDWVQGAMRIARPWSLELAYTREMMAGLLLRESLNWPRNALLIGLGAGSLAKFIYRNLPQCRITAIEINPQVVFVARQYFKLPDDPLRLNIVIADGADYILRGDSTFDYILLDGFDADARAGVLDTLPFYQACRARLNTNGVLAANLLGWNRGFKDSVDRIATAFDQRCVALPACDSGNTVTFAGTGASIAIPLDEIRRRATELKKSTRLNLLPTVTRLAKSQRFPDGIFRI